MTILRLTHLIQVYIGLVKIPIELGTLIIIIFNNIMFLIYQMEYITLR